MPAESASTARVWSSVRLSPRTTSASLLRTSIPIGFANPSGAKTFFVIRLVRSSERTSRLYRQSFLDVVHAHGVIVQDLALRRVREVLSLIERGRRAREDSVVVREVTGVDETVLQTEIDHLAHEVVVRLH